MRVFEAKKPRGFLAHTRQFVDDLLESGPQQCAEIGNVGEVALAPEQQSADLVLEQLDRAAQRGLRHVTSLGRPGEIAGLADGEEIADMMNVHGSLRPA